VGQVPVFIFHRNKVAQFYPWAQGSFNVVTYDLRDYGEVILTRFRMGEQTLQFGGTHNTFSGGGGCSFPCSWSIFFGEVLLELSTSEVAVPF
jgi:hypothetical protein